MSGTRKIRVLHLGNPTGLYGAERWIIALAKHLPETIVESVIGVVNDDFTPDPPLCAQARRLGLQSQIFESPGKLSFSAIGQLRRFVREHDIRVLHTHGYKTDLIGLLAVRGTGCKLVSTPHGWSTNAGLKLQVYEVLDRIAFQFFDAVVPLSPDLYDGLRKFPRLSGKLHLIQNGVDLGEIDSIDGVAPEIEAWRAGGDCLIGYVGQLISRKGIDTLIAAFHGLGISRARLIIVGEGPQRAELEALVTRLGDNGRVHFLGYRKDRLELLQGFDVFVLPSALEGIPRCLLEAMASGIPVIATDIPGCTDLVQHDVTGLLFGYGDHARLSQLLGAVLTDPPRRASLAAAGRSSVRAKFSAAVMASQYADLYATLMGTRIPTCSEPQSPQAGQ